MKIVRSGCGGRESQRLDRLDLYRDNVVLVLQLALDEKKWIVHHHHAIFGEYIERPRLRVRQVSDPLSESQMDAVRVLLASCLSATSVAQKEGFSLWPVPFIGRDLCAAIDPKADFR